MACKVLNNQDLAVSEKFTFYKSEDPENYIFEGYAAVFGVIDKHGDMLSCKAFEDLGPGFHASYRDIKFLWQHDSFYPLGSIQQIKPDSYGLKVKVAINTGTEKGKECIALIKQGVINSLSIGFQITSDHYDSYNDCRVIDSAKLLEVSAVTFPANEKAKISSKTNNNHIKGGNMTEDVTTKVDSLTKELNEFKRTNENKLTQLEKQMEKNSELEAKLNNLEAFMDRPGFASDNSQINYKNEAMEAYIRKGEIDNSYTTKALSHTESEDGGYLVQPEIYNKIIEEMKEISPIRKLASIEKISSNALELILEHDKFKCGWVNDISEMQEETETPRMSRKKIYVHELFAQPKASQRLIDDAMVDVESWLIRQLKESFARTETDSFINGDGNNKPRGLLAYDKDQITRVEAANYGSEGNAKLSYEMLNAMLSQLNEQHRVGASFLMHRETLTKLRDLKNESGQLIWQPSLSEKSPETIFGLPVYTCDQMPRPHEGEDAIVLANFSEAYKIVDRKDMGIMRDPYTEKPFVKFYATKRVGGDIVNRDAIVIGRLF